MTAREHAEQLDAFRELGRAAGVVFFKKNDVAKYLERLARLDPGWVNELSPDYTQINVAEALAFITAWQGCAEKAREKNGDADA